MSEQTEPDYFTVPVDIILPSHWLGKVRYRLHKDVYIAGYRVPAGFVTDGASVPRMAWWIFPPVGRYLVAAIVHDHALERGMGWRVSNNLFYQVLRDLDIRGWRRLLIVGAVRLNARWQHIKHAVGLGGNYVS